MEVALLEIKDTSVSYGKREIIRYCGIGLREGKLTAFLGLNGSGKTIMLEVSCGLLRGRSVAWRVCSKDAYKMNEKQKAQLISYVSRKDTIICSISTTDVVAMGFNPYLNSFSSPPKGQKERARDAIQELGLEEKAGADFMLLSEGQKQLIILAGITVQNAPVTLSDEPDSAPDFSNHHLILLRMRGLTHREGEYGSITLHDLNFALEYCDETLILKSGRVRDSFMPGLLSAGEVQRRTSLLYDKIETLEHNEKFVLIKSIWKGIEMEKILKADLTTKGIEVPDYGPKLWGCYGRGSALKLVASSMPCDARRYSSENVIALVPGILTGCKIVGCCRVTTASKRGKGEGLQVCNVSENLPQKMASLSIAGLLVCGKSTEKDAALHIGGDSAEIIHMSELEKKDTGIVVERLEKRFGADTAVLGVGKAADIQLSLSTFFCTYPDGDPEYHCPRNGFGDVLGSRGLRTVVVTGNGHFGHECRGRNNFFRTGRRLARIILRSEVHGQALPVYGSITLLELLKDRGKGTDFLERDSQKFYNRTREPSVRIPAAEKQREGRREARKTNYCCASMCAVGCLNRHMSNDGEAHISPDQSEVMAALKEDFNIDDMTFTKQVQRGAMDLGITGTEFVAAAKMYLSVEGKRQDREGILGLLEEIGQGTLTGGLATPRIEGILRLYSDREDLVPLLDRKATDDEMRFNVRLERIDERHRSVPGTEYLYDQIFVPENLGLYIFTSFVLLSNREAMELMTELFTYRIGVKTDFIQPMEYVKGYREKEMKYEEDNSIRNMGTSIPPPTEVLYRYFEKQSAFELLLRSITEMEEDGALKSRCWRWRTKTPGWRAWTFAAASAGHDGDLGGTPWGNSHAVA